MKTFGLIGYPLSHSFSPGYFNDKFEKENINAVYKLFPLDDITEFPNLLKRNEDLSGLNVTIPYKEKVIPYLSSIQGDAREIKAVNTIAFDTTQSPVRLPGFNTDAYGFERSIKSHLKNHHKKAIVLGTGGSSKTVSFVLEKLGIEHIFITRHKNNRNEVMTYHELSPKMLGDYQVVINTTPSGMFPNTSQKPDIPYDGITSSHLLFDLIYNPSLTSFLQEGEKRGADIENGLNMLRFQAEESWNVWNQYISW